MGPLEIWRVLGGAGDPPSLLGTRSGPLLVIGGGRTVWADLAAAAGPDLKRWKGEILAVNDVGAHYHHKIAHWATLHPGYMPGWMDYRLGHCYGNREPVVTHAQRPHPGIDCAWRLANVGGTSGLFACYVGLMLGYGEIALAGVPIDNAGHYFDPPGAATDFADRATGIAWEAARDGIFAGRVTSLSGNTRAWLGPPAWLVAETAGGRAA